MNKLNILLSEIQQCTVCSEDLPHGPRPILRTHSHAKILIVGQAPGRKVHESGVPWDDASGNRLRDWLGVDKKTFYDPKKFALVPMGFCFPGTGKRGDLAPRKECAVLWHERLLSLLPNIEFTILLSLYAHRHYLGADKKNSLTETVKAWIDYLPDFVPLPHPSPRNNIWLKKNPWFEKSVIFELQKLVRSALS